MDFFNQIGSRTNILYISFRRRRLVLIYTHAFMSCKNARIVVIPSTIEQIEDHAFDHSLIQVIIFEGQYTMWKAMTHDNQDLYVYCSKDSNVVRSISPFEQNSFLHIKKKKH
ncbi:MAG: leucine-rich repeat protein [Clostridiaceae bacterium]|nr:leucine-rich repeat protein [Clostridiaceae bacterium]